uniref:CCHC-type domain-containing protein n=1 Tax=Fagus sylvatica TaxID=28930 RepID=A0A2N9ETC0_FAGSY
MEEVPEQISVENLVSRTKRLGWQGNKVRLEVDTDKEDEAKLLLIVRVADRNIFIFEFKHEVDLRRAWDRRPWSIKGEHLILKKFNASLSLNEGSRFVRVRVEVDVNCPLSTGFPLDRDEDNLPTLWIPFKYEKLGNFCYGCGKLGHEQRDCSDNEVQIQLREGVDFGLFGKWLRADNNEFQPGLNSNGLLEANLFECNLGGRDFLFLESSQGAIQEKIDQVKDDKEKQCQKAVAAAVNTWNETVQEEKLERTDFVEAGTRNDEDL